MTLKNFLFTALLLSPLLLFSQKNDVYTYLGVIDVDGLSQYTYQLNYKIDGNVISGSTITNAGNSNETKTFISGKALSNGSIEFKETNILKTLVKDKNTSFCMVSARLNKRNKMGLEILEGKFTGTDKSGKSCGTGTIHLVRKVSVIPDSVKQVLSRVLKDSSIINRGKIKPLSTISLNKVFCKSDNVRIRIYDSGYLDKDEISVYYHGQILLQKTTLSKEGNILLLNIKKDEENIISIKTLNEGEFPPNTATIDITTADGAIETYQLNAPANNMIAIELIKKK